MDFYYTFIEIEENVIILRGQFSAQIPQPIHLL